MSDGDLRKLFRLNLPRFDWTAVETGLTSRGVPDSNYCYEGVEGWLEMKKTRGPRVLVSPEQIAWAERRLRHGGKVFCAVRHGKDMSLFDGWAMRQLRLKRIDEVEAIGTWTGGPSNWAWSDVASILSHP